MKKSFSTPLMRTTLRTAMLVCALLIAVTALVGCKKSDPPPAATTTEAPKLTLQEDYQTPTFPSVGTYINYSANSSIAGTIENGGTHRVDTANPGTVKAVPYTGYKFVKWSDGSTDPQRNDTGITENQQLIAYFDYETLEMPIICIDTITGADVESKTEYIFGTMSAFNSDSEHFLENLDIEIRGRGNYSWTSLAKKSYKLKLSEKQSLMGLGKGKSKNWVLLANMCDQSMLRNYLSLHLAGSMPNIAWSPDCTSVELYLNGEYRGVYLLCEEIDANKNKVNVQEDLTGAGSTDIDFLIELSANPKTPSFYAADRKYQIHSDLSSDSAEAAEQKNYIHKYVKNAWTAVKSGDEQAIAELIDIDSMVDAYLVEEITKNLDCGYDSFYLYRNKGGKLTFGPVWDFDNSLGNANEGTERYQYLYAAYNEINQNNPWFYTIMNQQWFRQRVLERWDEIANIRSKLSSTVINAAEAGYNSFCRNFEAWDLFGKSWNRETEQITSLKNYKEHYEFLASWIDLRLEWMDEFFHSKDFMEDWTGKSTAPETDEPDWPDWPDWPDQPDNPDVPPIADGVGNEAYKTLTDSHTRVEVDGDNADSNYPGHNNEGVDRLFDDEIYTKYCCATGLGWWGGNDSATIEITFSTKNEVALSGFAIVTANDNREYRGRNPEKISLYGKGADGNYVLICEVTDADMGLSDYNFTGYGKILENTAAYSDYKLVLIESSDTLQIGEFCLYTK